MAVVLIERGLSQNLHTPVWDWEEEQKNKGEVTLGKATLVRLTEQEINQVHEYVITHSVVTIELYRYVSCH
jgi:hypothetical protein